MGFWDFVAKPISDLRKNPIFGGKKDQPEDGGISGTPIPVDVTNDPDKYISDESIHSPCAGPHVAIGIDLGTCNASAGAFKGNHVGVIETSDGKRKIPCCVSFTKIGRLIGVAAEDQAENYMNNTIFNVKGLIGSTCNTYNIQDYKKGWAPLNIKETNNRPTVQVEYQGGHKEFLPEEIASMILVEMKECAKAYLKSNVKDAVITVPANFTDSQRIATRDAGCIAGLNVLEIINDTTAAAITYHSLQIWNEHSKEKNVLIMDLGGGTFNIAVIKVTTDNIEVKSAAGSTFGGGDFEANLVGNFVEINKNKFPKDILNDQKTLAKLRKAFEKAKRMLFKLEEAQVNVPSFIDGNDLPLTVTRAMFEEVNWRQLKWCTEAVKACVLDAKMEPYDIDDIVLVGGSSRIPHVQQFLQTYFKKEHFQKIHPDEAVVQGAAIRAAFLTNNKEELQGFPSISPNPPAIQNIRPYFSIWSYDFHYKVHMPISEIKLTTNKPHEMSISTTTDRQVSIPIFVYGGEGPSLHAQFSISGIPPRSAAFVHAGEGPNLYTQFTISGIPPQQAPMEISISFTINNDGILSLKAHAKIGEKTDFLVKKEYFEGLRGWKIKKIKEKEADMSKIEEQDKLRREKRLAAIVSFKSFISKKKSEFKDKPTYSAIEDQAKSAYKWMRSNPDATEEEIMNQMKEFEVNCNNLLIEP